MALVDERVMMKRLFFSLLLFVVMLGSVPLVSVAQVAAQAAQTPTEAPKCDEEFYSKNDILFYNPCANKCSAATGSGTGAISALRGSGNGQKIFNFWLDAGLTPQQSAGVLGSMWHEGGFSPFRQEIDASWENGGWGIAQFTGIPGQRQAAKEYVRKAVGDTLFNQYYKDQYGRGVDESNGFVPAGVPVDVNDKFLLGELNYLLDHIKQLYPNDVRTGFYKRDFNKDYPSDTPLFTYLKTLVKADDVAIAWTYLYEFPGNIKSTSLDRGRTATDFAASYGASSSTGSTGCGSALKSGGMDLATAIKFMNDYKNTPGNTQYLKNMSADGGGCNGGPLSNCVSFSVFFINKYTTLKGFDDPANPPGNGSTVVANAIARNPGVANGHSPQPYAIFSTPSGEMMCGSVKCGHTGVILGVDTTNKKVVVGEASCGQGLDWDTAREYPLSQFDSNEYTYIYTSSNLKETPK